VDGTLALLECTSKQLVAEPCILLLLQARQPVYIDYKYEWHGTVIVFMLSEPLARQRRLHVTDRRTAADFAQVLCPLVEEQYPATERILLVMDNLNTHQPASLYEVFAPAEARRLVDRLQIHYTPEHGSWLNMAETELSILATPCINRRIADTGSASPEGRCV
jgi:hypothetical protein